MIPFIIALSIASAGPGGEAAGSDPFSTFPGLRPLGKNLRGRPEYLHERTGIVLVSIPGGEFLMGTEGRGEDDERPRRRVAIAPFLLGKHEVTQEEWARVLDWNPSAFQGAGRPVENVTWEDCRRFCLRVRLSLPAEAEWEYACRAGSESTYPFGEDRKLLDEHAWYLANSGHSTHPAGGKEPNGFGLHDLLGNVWEWCEDGYHESHEGAPADGSARPPVAGPMAEQRIIRGGCWSDTPWCCRSAERGRQPLGRRGPQFGFRVALRTCPPVVQGDEASIRAWLDLACRQAIELERPADAHLSIGFLAEALLPRDPVRFVALDEALVARPDGRSLEMAAAMHAGRLAEAGRLDLADRLAAGLPEASRSMASIFIIRGLAARGEAAEARSRLAAIEDPDLLPPRIFACGENFGGSPEVRDQRPEVRRIT